MQGKVAGVNVTSGSGAPGGNMIVRIRGNNSVIGSNDPLYVIDGFPIDNSTLLSRGGAAGLGNNQNPRNPLNALNPNDIESIEILKDASATAIYGSRGANGVILVTTKKGKSGSISVNYDFYAGTQSVTENMDVLTAREYIEGFNAISIDRGEGPILSQEDINRIGDGTDWQEQIYLTAPLSNHNLSASGGDENTKFYASLNYFDQDGVIKNSGIKKYIGRLNLERSIGDRAQIGFNLNTSLVEDSNNVDGLNINEAAGPIYTALLYDPTEPVFDSDGSFFQSPNLTINNPLSLVNGVFSESETDRPWLPFKTHGGSAGLLRAGKGTIWEGGMREPCIFWGPGKIKSAAVSGLGSTMDLFATFSSMAGIVMPDDRIMDSFNLTATLLEGKESLRQSILYYRGPELYAARLGDFKAHYITQGEYGQFGERKEHELPLLYNLSHDPSEQYDVAAEHPEVLSQIEAMIEAHREKLEIGPDQLSERE